MTQEKNFDFDFSLFKILSMGTKNFEVTEAFFKSENNVEIGQMY